MRETALRKLQRVRLARLLFAILALPFMVGCGVIGSAPGVEVMAELPDDLVNPPRVSPLGTHVLTSVESDTEFGRTFVTISLDDSETVTVPLVTGLGFTADGTGAFGEMDYTGPGRKYGVVELDGTPRSTVTIPEAGRGIAAVSPDGRHLATLGANNRLLVAGFETDEVTVFDRVGNGPLALSWSPDGSSIAMTVDGDLLIADVERGTIATLNTDRSFWGPHVSWSPDSSMIAAVSADGPKPENRNEPHLSNLFLLDLDSAEPHVARQLSSYDGSLQPFSHTWSQDGSEILVSHTPDLGITGYSVIDVSAGSMEPLQFRTAEEGPDVIALFGATFLDDSTIVTAVKTSGENDHTVRAISG